MRHTMTGCLIIVFVILCSVPMSSMAQSKQQLRDSLKAASELLGYYPDSVDLRLRKAAWNVQLEQWEYAKSEYDKVIMRYPENITARYFRAFVNEKLKRYDFARLDYQSVLTVVPGNFEARLGLALLNYKDKHFTEAMDQINQLVNQYPDSAIVYAARGGFEQESGKLELAEYDFKEAIRLDGSNTDYRLNHIKVLIALKRRDEAVGELDALQKNGVPQGMLLDLYRQARARRGK